MVYPNEYYTGLGYSSSIQEDQWGEKDMREKKRGFQYNKNGGILGIPRLKNYREEEVVRQKKLQVNINKIITSSIVWQENAENQREKRAARSQSSAEVETEEESFLRTPPRPTANPPVSASSNLVATSQSTVSKGIRGIGREIKTMQY